MGYNEVVHLSGWPEEEEIFSLLNEQTRGSMKSGVSMGVSEISQELGHHSYGMNKPEMRSGVTTSLSSHKGSNLRMKNTKP